MTQAQLALPGVPGVPDLTDPPLADGSSPDASAEWVWTEEAGEETDVPDFVHETVMQAEVVHALGPTDALYIDATVGGGGHAEAILEAHPRARVLAVDRDSSALDAARERLARFGDRVTFVKAPFGRLDDVVAEHRVEEVAGLCADLGVSSPQLDDAARGMSFRREGPIDMRMDPESGETALELIDRLSDDDLADVLYRFGEERRSRRIARSIKRALADNQLETTLDLRRAIVRAVGPVRVGGVDPATRSFQALRIAVNQEVGELEALLGFLPQIVRLGGVAAIISFHSLEDRLVKRAFRDRAVWEPITKKPLVASDEEAATNPRARSAKLRTARRVPVEPDGP